MPQILSIVDLAEKQLSGNQARRETLVACSGNTRTTLVVLNQDQAERLYDGAEIEYYVVAGQGAVRLNGRDTPLSAGSYVSVPRNTSHGIVRRGNRALILLSVLSGEAVRRGEVELEAWTDQETDRPSIARLVERPYAGELPARSHQGSLAHPTPTLLNRSRSSGALACGVQSMAPSANTNPSIGVGP